MMDLKTIFDAVAVDSALGEALGPLAAIAFVALGAALVGVTLGVMVRGMLEQLRGPAEALRPEAVRAHGQPSVR